VVTEHTPRAAHCRRFHADPRAKLVSLSPANTRLASLNIVTGPFPHFIFSSYVERRSIFMSNPPASPSAMEDSTAMPEQSGSAYGEPKDVVQDASADIAQSQQAASDQECRKMAAKVESNVPRARVSIVEATGAVSNDLEISRTDHEINRLWMQLSLWKVTGNSAHLHAMARTLKGMAPDLAKRPSNAGTAAFYCFDQALGEAEAKEMITEMKVFILHERTR
jgi:hypothetical protein